MDKNAIKKFAAWARRELISRVSQKAAFYGITDIDHGTVGAESVDGRVLSATEKKQRDALIHQIQKDGYEQVMEEVAYTWFNRFSALRYMEVNGYLPTHVRVFTDESGALKPQILTEAINLELDGLDMQKVYDLKNSNQDEALYRYLLITQCNALNAILPGMFQKIEDYTELLLPDNLLRKGSVIEQMVTIIPEEDWTDQVQIIGWMYQYYNAEKKDEVFAALKKNVKITKENIPAATQLFTPDWIVRYMVENSLGRLWLEGHPNDALKSQWKYYLEEAQQEPEVQAQLTEIRKEYAALNPEEIRCIDPCMGSGHILVYMFDVLVQIYEAYGYSARDAVKSIVENNLYGLDIDDRAAQLAYFAVMMKARQYDRRFFSRGLQPHVYAIMESNHVDKFALEYFCNGDEKLTVAMNTIITELHDAKEYGSILKVTPQDWSALYARFAEIEDDINISRETALNELLPLVQVAEALAQKYDVVVTNPPYMGASNMNPKLSAFIKKNYADYKSDFFSSFVIHCSEMTKKSGYCGFFTPYVWMFIQSYEKMRTYLYTQATIETLIQFEYSAFEEATVPVCTFAFQNRRVNKKGCYLRLVDFRGGMEVQRQKTMEAIENHNCGFYYEQSADNFSKIPGCPVAYWISDRLVSTFANGKLIGALFDIKHGMSTGDNDACLRLWNEVKIDRIAFMCADYQEFLTTHKRWVPFNKGGEYRRWYGNNVYILGYDDEYNAIMDSKEGHRHDNPSYYFRDGGTWTTISSGLASFRRYGKGFIFSNKGSGIFKKSDITVDYIIGLLNSCVCKSILEVLSPTIGFELGYIAKIPFNMSEYQKGHLQVELLERDCVQISKMDWDSYETSWDFKQNPMI